MQNNIIVDEIVEINEIGEEDTIDITVSGNNLFFANDILTHNSGINNSDIDITDTSESMGAPMTFDFMMALIATEELDKMNQLMIKQLKNRFGDPNRYGKFCVGIDRSKMKLYNLETSANHEFEQNVQENNKPVFDNTEAGKDFNNADFKF